MSRHETALALVATQIEATHKTLSAINVKLMKQRADVERTEKEAKFLNWTLEELTTTQELLVRDKSMNDHPSTPSTTA